eukprot:TRINITY_DN2484_c0_g4_i2.p1 TRINITY_DN2484_c0_g4~~TRINITY_DN2484_c0_g4_i2.p1  ORF type:complete len:183 (+),score=35.71 TRINITY_DN2484_c0_g4_i2:193-741(+)
MQQLFSRVWMPWLIRGFVLDAEKPIKNMYTIPFLSCHFNHLISSSSLSSPPHFNRNSDGIYTPNIRHNHSALNTRFALPSTLSLLPPPSTLSHDLTPLLPSRILMACVIGSIAGIMGLTGIVGLLFYFTSVLMTALVAALKTGFKLHTFFQSTSDLYLSGVFDGLMSYILFWTMFYNVVHLF